MLRAGPTPASWASALSWGWRGCQDDRLPRAPPSITLAAAPGTGRGGSGAPKPGEQSRRGARSECPLGCGVERGLSGAREVMGTWTGRDGNSPGRCLPSLCLSDLPLPCLWRQGQAAQERTQPALLSPAWQAGHTAVPASGLNGKLLAGWSPGNRQLVPLPHVDLCALGSHLPCAPPLLPGYVPGGHIRAVKRDGLLCGRRVVVAIQLCHFLAV